MLESRIVVLVVDEAGHTAEIVLTHVRPTVPCTAILLGGDTLVLQNAADEKDPLASDSVRCVLAVHDLVDELGGTPTETGRWRCAMPYSSSRISGFRYAALNFPDPGAVEDRSLMPAPHRSRM